MIIGGGRLGSFLGSLMNEKNRKVVIIEKDEAKIEDLKKELKDSVIVNGDGCSPDVLRRAGILEAEVVVASTGHDEDNLIVCQLAKFEYGVAKVVSRINNPKNEWLFTKDMGVDAAVSGARMIATLIEEETEISHITTLLNLTPGKISIAKSVIEGNSKAAHKQIKELSLPSDCVLVTIVRDNKVILPKGNTAILPGDEVFSIVAGSCRAEFEEKFGAQA
jgi:K+ transport systems, NAD-binding component